MTGQRNPGRTATVLIGAGLAGIVAVLVTCGVVWYHNQHRDDVFYTAIEKGDVATVKAWLDRGEPLEPAVDPNAEDHITNIGFAAMEGQTEVVRLLLDRGDDPNLDDDNGTLIEGAAREGHFETVKLLIERGAVVNDMAANGSSALWQAVNKGDAPLVTFLLHHGALTETRVQINYPGWTTVLQLARQNGFPQIERILRRAGAR